MISDEIAKEMLEDDPENKDVIFPYLNGQDVNSNVRQEPSRWVINFWDWPEERARNYRRPWSWIEEYVKPVRQRKKPDGSFKLRKPLPERWWQFGEKRPGLYHSIGWGEFFENHPDGWIPRSERLKNVLVAAQTTRHLSVSLLPNDLIFSAMTIVIAIDSFAQLAAMNSSHHIVFAWQNASLLKNDLRYTPTDVFEPFPWSAATIKEHDQSLEALGQKMQECRRNRMESKNYGLTKLLNEFHNPDILDDSIVELREIQRAIDERVSNLFLWNDIFLSHDFHKVSYLPEHDRVRFTISEDARREILQRLSELNRKRHQEEVEQRLHVDVEQPKKKIPTACKTKQAVAPALTLDLETPSSATTVEEPKVVKPEPPIERLYNWLYNQGGKWMPKNQAAAAISVSTEEVEDIISTLVADGDLQVRDEGEEMLLRVET